MEAHQRTGVLEVCGQTEERINKWRLCDDVVACGDD